MSKKFSQRLKGLFGKRKISESIQTEIFEAQNLYKDFKLDLALQSLNKLSKGQMEGLPIEIQLQFHTLKGKILTIMENYGEAITSAEKSYEIASKFEKFNDSIEKIDSFLLIAEILMRTGKYEKSYEILKDVDKNINNLPDKLDILKKEKRAEKLKIHSWLNYNIGKMDEIGILRKELHNIYTELGDLHNLASNYTFIAWFFFFQGDIDKALENLNKSNEIFNKIEKSPFFGEVEVNNLILHGAISSQRGDLFESIKYNEDALILAKKNNFLYFIYNILNNLGCTYLEFADWDKSILYFSQALKMAENMQDTFSIVNFYGGLFNAYLNKGDIKTAEEYLEHIIIINDSEQNKRIDQVFRSCQALLLRKSKRTRDLGKAQEMLKEISEEEIIHIEIVIRALINLCEMLVLEFKESKDPDVLNDLNPLINKLYKIAESQKSYLVMAETLLLKSKVAIISLKLTEARQLLNQAQIIAKEHGLKTLAIKISVENDELINNLEIYEKMKLENEPIEKRFDKINIEKQLNDMLHKNKFEIPEINDEDPVLIMVMTDSGLPLYTRVFKEEWDVNDQLFSGFLSAFNSFSDEIFKKGFDRAVFGDYSILMNSTDNFMISYIFLGQSYLAKQRFSKFSDKIQNTESIQEKLIYSKNTGLVLYPKDLPELEAQINEIFIQKDSIL